MLKNRKNPNRRAGFVTTPELVLLLTIGAVGMMTGFSVIQGSMTEEYTDLAGSIGKLNQSWRGAGRLPDGSIGLDAAEFIDLFDRWDYGVGGPGNPNANSVPAQPPVMFIQTSELLNEQAPTP